MPRATPSPSHFGHVCHTLPRLPPPHFPPYSSYIGALPLSSSLFYFVHPCSDISLQVGCQIRLLTLSLFELVFRVFLDCLFSARNFLIVMWRLLRKWINHRTYRASHSTWNPQWQHATAATRELPGNVSHNAEHSRYDSRWVSSYVGLCSCLYFI